MTTAGLASGDGYGAGAGDPEAAASIGSVLDALRADFPEITISKIRFLESEGLISPARTPSGYRQFSPADVSRLRFVLSAQRDHYLPLKVIRSRLAEFDADPTATEPTLGTPVPSTPGPPTPTPAPPAAPTPLRQGPTGPTGPTGTFPRSPGPVRPPDDTVVPPGTPAGDPDADPALDGGRLVPRATLLAEDGVDEALLDALEHHGVLRADASGTYEPEAIALARTAAALAALGVEPRLLRGLRAGADREVGLLTQLVTPVALSRGPEAARRADALSGELAALSGRLHALLVGAGLRRGLRR